MDSSDTWPSSHRSSCSPQPPSTQYRPSVVLYRGKGDPPGPPFRGWLNSAYSFASSTSGASHGSSSSRAACAVVGQESGCCAPARAAAAPVGLCVGSRAGRGQKGDVLVAAWPWYNQPQSCTTLVAPKRTWRAASAAAAWPRSAGSTPAGSSRPPPPSGAGARGLGAGAAAAREGACRRSSGCRSGPGARARGPPRAAARCCAPTRRRSAPRGARAGGSKCSSGNMTE